MKGQNMFLTIDAIPPAKIAEKAEETGIAKATLDFWMLIVLSILAGAFIALGAVFSTTVTAGAEGHVYLA